MESRWSLASRLRRLDALRKRGVRVDPLLLALIGILLFWFGRASIHTASSSRAHLLGQQLRDLFYEGAWKAVDLSAYDRMAAAQDALMPEIVEGHSGQLAAERKAYVAVASMPFVKRICEIGFNGGHSAGLWLRAAPQAEIVMFDLWNHTYNEKAEEFLREPTTWDRFDLPNYPDKRLTIIKGPSQETVPKFAHDHTEFKCDILSIDGGHTTELAFGDIWAMQSLANRDFHVVFLDDTNCEGFWCIGPKKALEQAMSVGIIRYIAGITEPENIGRGLSILQYRNAELPN